MSTIKLPTPDWIRDQATARGLSIPALCRRADMHPESFYRWNAGLGTPTLATVQKMLDAIAREPAHATVQKALDALDALDTMED
jgi:predicted transcriptional regulator